MSKYDIDFTEGIRQWLPVELRKKKFKSWLKSLIKPAILLYNLFLAFRVAILYELDHNGQMCRLRAVLNDRYDTSLRRIYIDDAPIIEPFILYRRDEVKPKYFRKRSESLPNYGRRRNELTYGGVFIVKIPVGIVYDLEELKALIEKYKLAGKAYKIQTF